jgi:hypothetical protein
MFTGNELAQTTPMPSHRQRRTKTVLFGQNSALSNNTISTVFDGECAAIIILYGELGRYPLEIEIKARMVTYWSRLFSSEVEKWYYIMCRITNEHLEKGYLNTGWSATIRNILNQCGVGVIWNNPGTMSPMQPFKIGCGTKVKGSICTKMESRYHSRPEASMLLCD